MYTVKSYFINELRNKHDIPYSTWQKRFYTKIVDTRNYLKTVIRYIQNNPAKAGLPAEYQKSPYQYFDWAKLRKLM